jgi:hypothetical protein
MSIFRASILLLILCILAAIISTFKPDESWTDQVLLHDGRVVDSIRSVAFHYGGGELSQALTKWPDQYALKIKNPNTGELVNWQSPRGFNQVAVDFWEGSAYGVILQSSILADLKQYGCPTIPYVFFRYDQQNRTWEQISATKFPVKLQRINLSVSYDGTYMKNSRTQTVSDIVSRNHLMSKIKPEIPTSFESWNSEYKNPWRVGHYQDGCRETVPSNEDPTHPQSIGQNSKNEEAEVVETKVYDPPMEVIEDKHGSFEKWNALSFNETNHKQCMSYIEQVSDYSSRPELRGWFVFVNDPTGNNKAKFTGGILCNTDAIWFTDYVIEKGRVVLTKFTTTGNFIYRLSFARPDTQKFYEGYIVQSSFKSDGKYLTFDWWNSDQGGYTHTLKRSLKIRLKEPD